jgi:hypothetical protein
MSGTHTQQHTKKKKEKKKKEKPACKGDKKKDKNFGEEKGTSWRLDWEDDNYEPGDVGSDDVDAADDESDESESRTSISPEGTIKAKEKKATCGKLTDQQKKKATVISGNLRGDNQKRGTPSLMTKGIALLAMLEVDKEKKIEEKRKMMEEEMRMKRMRIEACLKTREENEKDLEAELKGSRSKVSGRSSRASSSRK